MKTTISKSGLTLLAKENGYAYTYANRTQAEKKVAVLVAEGHPVEVYKGIGRPFYIRVSQ